MDFTALTLCSGLGTELFPCPGREKVSKLSLRSSSCKMVSGSDSNALELFTQLGTKCVGFRIERGAARGMVKYARPDRNTLQFLGLGLLFSSSPGRRKLSRSWFKSAGV